MDFELPPPPPTLPSSLPSHPIEWRTSRRNFSRKNQPTDQPSRERDLSSPASGRDKKQWSHPPFPKPPASPTHGCCVLPLLGTTAPHGKVPAFELKQLSPQLIKNTFQNQVYLHFNNICNYNYSSSSEELLSCMQITEFIRSFTKQGTRGLQSAEPHWVLRWKLEKSQWPPWGILLSKIPPPRTLDSCHTRSRQE